MKRFLVLLGVLATLAHQTLAASESGSNTVFIIPVREMIEPALVYVIRRGLSEAEAVQARAVIFLMDTPGGTVDAASDIVRAIQQVKVPTYTFVERKAISAGAIIALATDHIYMSPGSMIGDAMPIMLSPLGGGPQELPGDVQEKMVSFVESMIKSAAEQGGHDRELAQKMVRRDSEYRIGDTLIAPSNRLLTLTNVEAEQWVKRDGHTETRLLSAGTVATLNELMQREGLSSAAQRHLEVTAVEKVARFIAAFSSFFLMAGLLGIYIEIKTPGFGLPGLLGGLSLAIFFWGHHIAGLAGMEEITIFLVGLALILVELFVFPTVGILGLIGGGLMLTSLLMSMFQNLPTAADWPLLPELQAPITKLAWAMVMTAAAALLLGRFLPKTSAFRRLALETSTAASQGYVAVPAQSGRVGMTGRTISSLRPAGAALFGDERLDVMTRGEYLPEGKTVKVVDVRGGSLIVEEVPS